MPAARLTWVETGGFALSPHTMHGGDFGTVTPVLPTREPEDRQLRGKFVAARRKTGAVTVPRMPPRAAAGLLVGATPSASAGPDSLYAVGFGGRLVGGV